MKNGRTRRTTGLTLIEMTLVVATIALLVGFAVPAVRALMNSFQSQGGVQSMVNAALSSARAMAMSGQRYVGVRFQKLCTSDDPLDPLQGLLDAPQYMVFITHEEPKKMGGLANGFRAVDGLEPIKLPSTIGVMDLSGIGSDAQIDDPPELSDATTFSIVFSPSGKLVVHDVRVRNRQGKYRPNNALGAAETSMDEVFNSVANICRPPLRRGMCLQDDYPVQSAGQTGSAGFGLGEEPSRTNFVIYELATLRAAYSNRAPWSAYLGGLKTGALYVSPYTGNLISSR
ncbi:MAG: hypothetical protein A2Y76_12130 [Planctomycetes bacterium RBG_13_60_9]|nr:MAG: hypothetical protein A2Y76_12130 [Planctomycetes bacterium RBG_13_60_9]